MGWKQWILVAVAAIVAKSWLESFFQPKLPRTVDGYCDPAFKQVGEIFKKNVESGFEPGAAISVYYKGARVVDLWGGYADVSAQRPWAEDTITMVYSVSKGLAAIVVATMAERGLIDYKAPVTKYWPEFGQKEKGNITVEMLLSHQAGLVLLDNNVGLLEVLNDREKVERVLASQGTIWPAGSQSGYHAISFGLFVDTLIRKVDPKGRTTGQIFREDIADVHGIDVYMNTPKDQFYRTARQNILPQWRVLLEALLSPKYLPLFGNMILFPNSLMGRCGSAVKEFTGDYNAFNNPELREVEMSSAMATATARGLAKLYGILSTGGINKETNERLLTQEIVTKLSTPLSTGKDAVLQVPTSFGPGTIIKEDTKAGQSLFGHSGHGGQIGFADKKKSIGIGYVTNFISIYGMADDPRYLGIEQAIYDSVRELEKK